MSKSLSWVVSQINQSDNIERFATDNSLKLMSSGDGRYILNYSDTILGTPKNWISHWCRGLTLSGRAHNYQIIANAFHRFYNLGENPEYLAGGETIDFDKPFEVQFKYDGSIILEYFYHDQVFVNTRGSFADARVNKTADKTWTQLFNLAKPIGKSDLLGHPELTYIWELCTPYNQVVDYYPEPFRVLLGAVDKQGREVPNVYCGKTYSASSLDDVFALLNKLKPTQEGFVIVQKQGDNIVRRKCKTKSWVELSHAKEANFSSLSGLTETFYRGDAPEVIAVFPHLKPQFDRLQELHNKLQNDIGKVWEEIGNIKDQKEFALKAVQYPFRALLFAKRKGFSTLELEKKAFKTLVELSPRD